jgi:quercetin dioxygenase-like cupin family protein
MMIKRHIHQVPSEKLSTGQDVYRQILIGPEETPNFAMRRFVIKAGGHMPKHTNTVEHEQLVLNGRAKIGIGKEVIEVQKDDVLYIPAGTPHWYQTVGEQDFEFLCLVPNQKDDLKILRPDGGDQ